MRSSSNGLTKLVKGTHMSPGLSSGSAVRRLALTGLATLGIAGTAATTVVADFGICAA